MWNLTGKIKSIFILLIFSFVLGRNSDKEKIFLKNRFDWYFFDWKVFFPYSIHIEWMKTMKKLWIDKEKKEEISWHRNKNDDDDDDRF